MSSRNSTMDGVSRLCMTHAGELIDFMHSLEVYGNRRKLRIGTHYVYILSRCSSHVSALDFTATYSKKSQPPLKCLLCSRVSVVCTDSVCVIYHSVISQRAVFPVREATEQTWLGSQSNTSIGSMTILLKRKGNDLDVDQANKRPYPQSSFGDIERNFTRAGSEGEETLCERCKLIDFDEILSRPMRGKRIQFVHCVGAPGSDWYSGKCPLCRFFLSIEPAKTDVYGYNENQNLCLYAFCSFFSFDNIYPFDKHSSSTIAFLGLVWADSLDADVAENPKDRNFGQLQKRFRDTISQYGFICPEITLSAPQRSLGRMLASSADFNLVRQWIRDCKKHHESCCRSEPRSSRHPRTLIDCLSRRLVDGPGIHHFVALSYVWGPQPSEVSSYPRDALPDSLPKTVEDAITATLLMNFRYLWVDRYCAGEEGSNEKHEEVRNMDSIYSQAQATLIAVEGKDADAGLPGVHNTPRVPQPFVKVGKHTLVSTMREPRFQIYNSAWRKRGWTYQEGVLSKRRVIFLAHQVFFECQSTCWQESIYISPDPSTLQRTPGLSTQTGYSVVGNTNRHAWRTLCHTLAES
jgi:hypothetical protein